MVWQNNLREIKKVVYKLKRSFGLKATVQQVTSQTHDVETGAISRTFNTITILRAILLPRNLSRDFVYDLAFIAANNNFTGGAYFDRDLRTMIVDAKDLPKDFEFKLKDHIEFDSKRYEVKNIAMAEQKSAWLLGLFHITSSETV